MNFASKFLFFVFFIFFGAAVSAGETALDSGDTAWVLVATTLVLFMTLPGLALFYSGMVRRKNVLSVITHCFSVACLVSILWMAFGYTLTFSHGGVWNGVIGGLQNAFMSALDIDALAGTIPESLFASFQMTFAIIAVALIVGSFAERVRFAAVLWFSGLWLALVYVPVAHWVWGGGWLSDLGALDFAGGLVVHIAAGTSGLVAAMVIGRRHGFATSSILPHNLPLTAMGTGMLWVGWFGFNAGSALSAGTSAAMAILVTQLASAAAALTWLVLDVLKHGKPSLLGLLTGVIAGLVAITPGSGFVTPAAALLIGVISSAVCFQATHWIKNSLRIDDSLDVFPVHGVGGLMGSILVGVLAVPSEGNTMVMQLWVQVFSSLFVVIWSALATLGILFFLKATIGLRVNKDAEIQGLDLSVHNERAYE